MIVAGTGHRPPKLGGYNAETERDVLKLAINALKMYKPSVVITGMAQGWDQALAKAAIHLKIPFYAYLPFIGQDKVWPTNSRLYYAALLKHADKVHIVSKGGYTKEAMQKRNEAMVNDCDLLLALWNGTPGGTENCLNYAQLVNKPYVNFWPQYLTDEEIPMEPINAASIVIRNWLGPL